MYDEVYTYADTHNDSTITLDFMSETGTYNRDNKHITDFPVPPVIRDGADDLIKRLVTVKAYLHD